MAVRNLKELGPNMRKIMSRLCANKKLVNLLYYTDKNPYSQPHLTDDEVTHKIFDKLIKVMPKVNEADNANSVVVLKVNNGTINPENNEFRVITFNIEVFVPLTQWFIKDENLRPFCIMGEIQESLLGKNINGMGKIAGGDFHINFLTEEMSAYEMDFSIQQYD